MRPAAALQFDTVESAGGDGLFGLFGVDCERGLCSSGLACPAGVRAVGGRCGMHAALTGEVPYLRLVLTDRISVWGTLGK